MFQTPYSLVGNAPEHDVVQQRDLFGQLHRRQRLETLGLRTLRLRKTNAHIRTVYREEF